MVTPRRAAAGVAVAGVLLSLGAAPACGSDCSETLTCADQPSSDDGAAEATGDRAVLDQGAGDRGDTGHADGTVGESGQGDVNPPPPDACDAAAVENCTNDFDDNCDGKVDCADPMCAAQGFSCVPAAPNGWKGPVAYYRGASASPACPSAYPTDALDGNSDPSQAPAQCTCACGAPQGASCSAVTVTYYQDTLCGGSSCGTSTLQGSQCASLPCAANGAKAGPPTVQGGSCTPMPGKIVPALQWNDAERACGGPVGGGCGGGMVCAASVGAPFGATQCVFQSGQQSCPSQYPNATGTTYGGANDSRDCSACNCGGPVGYSCTVPKVSTWADNCQLQTVNQFAADGSCNSLSFNGKVKAVNATSPILEGNASCPATGGTAQGSVTPTMPTSVCCL